jgi:hypothetical protein
MLTLSPPEFHCIISRRRGAHSHTLFPCAPRGLPGYQIQRFFASYSFRILWCALTTPDALAGRNTGSRAFMAMVRTEIFRLWHRRSGGKFWPHPQGTIGFPHAHTIYLDLCVSHDSHNKPKLFTWNVLTGFASVWCVFCAVRTGSVDELLVSESWNSSVGIETGYGLDCRSSIPGRSKKFISSSSIPGLGATQPPIQWVPWVLSPWVKRPGHESKQSPSFNAEVEKVGGIPPLPICLHGVMFD